MERSIEEACEAILRKELVPALGCTEPIAIAYAAALARETLGAFPERMTIRCSGNVVKNVKGVVVPGTGDLRGVEASAILGAVGGDASLRLEVLSGLRPEHLERTRALLAERFCGAELVPDVEGLLVVAELEAGGSSSVVEIRGGHTDVVRVERDGGPLPLPGGRDPAVAGPGASVPEAAEPPYERLTLAGIYAYATEADLGPVKGALDEQIRCNSAISREGLERPYGERVGATLLRCYGDGVMIRARAAAAAGADARMSGCAMPVVINSGSGNQGITASVPVIVFARDKGVPDETLYRALALSNLVSIHIKRGIGKLSAFCGAVSAACGSGAGITWLSGGDLETVAMTITNTLANTSGIICDGAKASCAAKVASSVDAAILSHCMAMDRMVFKPGEGIVMGDVEDTIRSVVRIGRDGMRSTDREILNIMMGC